MQNNRLASKSQKKHNSPARGEIVRVDNPSLFIDILCSDPLPKKKCQAIHSKRKKLFLIGILSVVISIIYVFSDFQTLQIPDSQIRDLLAEKEYAKCSAYVDQFLSKRPDNDFLQHSAVQAFTNGIMESGWEEKLNNGQFREAKQIIDEWTGNIRHFSDHQLLKELFYWIADAHQFFSDHNNEKPLIIFQDEYKIKRLIDGWESRNPEFRNLLSRLAMLDITDFHLDEIFYHLKMLRTYNLTYAKDVLVFKNNFYQYLENNNVENLIILIKDFQKKHPSIGGVKEIFHDSLNYQHIVKHLKSEEWDTAMLIIQENPFHTDLFSEKIEMIQSSRLFFPMHPDAKPVHSAPSECTGNTNINISDLVIMRSGNNHRIAMNLDDGTNDLQ